MQGYKGMALPLQLQVTLNAHPSFRHPQEASFNERTQALVLFLPNPASFHNPQELDLKSTSL